ncbi:DUF6986 family protein [Nocardioides sp. GCM10027113]|uniref:DUF6986 family protein n=1 Tax=unclassified Nocardioides TaxID=2615069 RepID=UPI003617A92B
MADVDLAGLTRDIDAHLEGADADLARHYPGERAGRQPVHTAYVPADRFTARTAKSYGDEAQRVVLEHAGLLLELLDGDDDLLDRLLEKLGSEPVEDVRIDFEDGYGTRPDDEEDEAATAAATALRAAIAEGTATPFHGIRVKSLEPATRHRGLRTLVRFVETLTDGGPLPDGFVVTLPKVTSVEQVEAMVLALAHLESALSLGDGVLRFEIQVETPQSVLGADGTVPVARMIRAAEGRCTGLHYGTYDYSAACAIAAPFQSLEHPAADHAKAVMQAAAAGTGVRLSDGSTNVLPVGDTDAVRRGWETHLRLVRRSLERGFYQGWDLHPAQLPTRYAATFRFYRDGFADAAERLSAYSAADSDRADGSVLDEPATARALADFLLRGLDCGALGQDETAEATGLDADRLADLARRPRREE